MLAVTATADTDDVADIVAAESVMDDAVCCIASEGMVLSRSR